MTETTSFSLKGNIVDVVNRRIFRGTVHVSRGRVSKISEEAVDDNRYILPGLVDAHIHVESSMLIPSEFARLSVVHGTVSTVSDPHEIANVLGIPGILFMLDNGHNVPFKFNFGASSCVPATPFETAGASLGVEEVSELLAREEIRYLSEMMNFPGVLSHDPEVMAKLAVAINAGKPIDGHAPGLRGAEAQKYIEAGISTDHECFALAEALDKLSHGMKILIREGSAARNFEALHPLIGSHPGMVMLCSDDKHPNDLVNGHINQLVVRALKLGYDTMDVLRSCTYNPVVHYSLPVGLLQEGDPADLIVVDNLDHFAIEATYINGLLVARDGKSLIPPVRAIPLNKFDTQTVEAGELVVKPVGNKIKVQQAIDGQLITREITVDALVKDNNLISDTKRDILKLVVKTRYNKSIPAIGFVNGFGLKEGAIASCVAHDSHNIVAVGADDQSIARAINLIVEAKGGISLVLGKEQIILPLPFAGIMTNANGYETAALYEAMDLKAKQMGSSLRAPYMTLSFMALLVIPELKLSDEGLFDGQKFAFTSLFS